MLGFLKRLFGLDSSAQQEIDPDEIVKEQWQADFSREDQPGKLPRVRFSITTENQYRAYLENGALCLGLKKTNCIVWSENMLFRYEDLDMKGRIRLDPRGGYAAAGFIFRMVDERTYYLLLVSNRGYFRLDLVRNGVPLALAGWTEAPYMQKSDVPFEFDLEIITYGSRILLLINGQWAGNWNEPSIPAGRIGFAAACYEEDPSVQSAAPSQRAAPPQQTEYTAIAMLRSFSVDSRIEETAKRYDEIEDIAPPDRRIRLAETFIALGQANPALVQLRKAWERREVLAAELASAEDAVILSAIQDENMGLRYTPEKELLLGTKLAMALALWDEAEEYIENALNRKGDLLPEFRNLKAALLYSRRSYDGLIQWVAGLCPETEQFIKKAPGLFADPSALFNLLGHAYFTTCNYPKAAESYDYAFALDEKNGLAAKNAAAAYELAGNGEKALDRYLKAGRAFLEDELYQELGLLIPKFQLLGKANWEAAALTGKWAFGIEDWKTAEKELDRAEKLRKAKQAPDPALYYLQALLLVRNGMRLKALELFEKAVQYAPDYPLFRFRLAENRYLLTFNPKDPQLAEDLNAALKVKEEAGETYGWIHNFAAKIALSKGNIKQGGLHLEKAAAMLGEVPEVRVNRAVSLYLQGSESEALKLLESTPEEDPKGLMTNCAGNLLVRSRHFEEADSCYRRALAIDPTNVLYRCNRASCLIELGRYGEADNVLTSYSGELTPAMLELIAFVSVKKGEYKRAETAARAALEIEPHHVPSLLQLGWAAAFTGRWDDVDTILDRLEELELNADAVKGKDDLETWMKESLYRTIPCASCGRTWEVERYPGRIPPLKIYAMPPDDMPAGICPGCGKVYCVGCRKDALDQSGRFVCPDCENKTLKLTDDGLKAILNEWAEKNVKKKRARKDLTQRRGGAEDAK